MNKMILQSVLGTIDMCPYAPRSKMIAAEIGAAGITAGASLLGNVLGFGSAKSANQTNLQIARENNQAQRELFHEQMAYNIDMWNKQNQYNLPVNQVQRLLAAGINPAAVYGNGTMSEAGQLTAPNAPQMQRAEVRPFMPDFDGVGQAVNAFFDNQMKSKAVESTGIDNQAKMIDLQFKAQHHYADLLEQKHRIDNIIADSHLKGEQLEYYKNMSEELGLNIQKFKDSYDLYIEREKLQNDVMKAQEGNLLADSTLKRAQSAFQSLVTSLYPTVTQAQLNVMSAQWTNLLNDATLKCKQGKFVDAQSVSQYLKNGLEAIEFEDKDLLHSAKTKNRISKTFFYSIDMIGDMMFRNLKLFGK